jgi:anti-sigma factor RsiW
MELKAHPFSEEEIMAYLDGALNVREEAEVREHVAACAECQGTLEQFEQLSAKIAAWKTPPVRADWQPAPIRKESRIVWQLMGAAAATLIVLLGLNIAFRGKKRRGLCQRHRDQE